MIQGLHIDRRQRGRILSSFYEHLFDFIAVACYALHIGSRKAANIRDEGIIELMTSLVGFDPDVCDRDEIGVRLRDINRVQGWVDHAKVRSARRLSELNAQGRSESAAHALMDEGRRSGREAKAIEDRERICNEFPALEDALATGAVSTDHLDSLTRLTRNLSDAERSDLHAVADDIVASATADWVSEFERKTKSTIASIRSRNHPCDEAGDLDRQSAESHMKRWTDKPSGMHMTLLALDPLRDAAIHTAIDAQLARLRQDPASADTAFAQLQVDAVVAAVSAGEPAVRVASITVHVDATSACHGRHEHTLCETVDGTQLPVSTVQRLCCEAVIDAVLIDPDGTVRALCTPLRTANRQQRRALAAMYATCAHPHCRVGFDHCRIHHVIWFTNGGKTELSNLIPLCETHHHLVHEGGWGLSMAPDRTVTWTRPDGTVWCTVNSIDRTRPRPPAAATPIRAALSTDWRQPSLC